MRIWIDSVAPHSVEGWLEVRYWRNGIRYSILKDGYDWHFPNTMQQPEHRYPYSIALKEWEARTAHGVSHEAPDYFTTKPAPFVHDYFSKYALKLFWGFVLMLAVVLLGLALGAMII